MSSLASALGLRSVGTIGTSNLAPYYVMLNFVLAYAAFSSRFLKQRYNIDHNVCPREDVSKYGEKAVQEGKISHQQLAMLKRNEAAHCNYVENFPFFVGSVLFAAQAGIPREMINWASLAYTALRIGYGFSYIMIETEAWSFLRTAFWWSANISCFYLLWKSGKALNAGL